MVTERVSESSAHTWAEQVLMGDAHLAAAYGDDAIEFDNADARASASFLDALAARERAAEALRRQARDEARAAQRARLREQYSWRRDFVDRARARFARPGWTSDDDEAGQALEVEVGDAARPLRAGDGDAACGAREGGALVVGAGPSRAQRRRPGSRAGAVGDEWDSRFAQLVAYKLEQGHANPPHLEGTTSPHGGRQGGGDVQLGPWCAAQRRAWRDGLLPTTHYRMLAMVGFAFDPRMAAWERKFVELAEHKNETGSCAPRRPTGERDPEDGAWQLYEWACAQRRAMRKGTLSAHQRARLEALGLRADVAQARWDRWYAQLKALKTHQGHLDTISPSALSNWAYRQRAAASKGKLSRDQWRRLNLLGFDWEVQRRR